jgi:hypothetical protein
MKLSMVLIIAAFFPVFCFAQTQTGNASYNVSKNGLHISHASMSFNTRVRVTNLRNNRQVIATVDSRIPVSDARVADISREAGDVIGMSPTGYTEVRLEQLPPEHTAVPAQSPDPNSPPEPPPPPPPVQQRPAQQSVPAPAPVPVQASRESIVETIQVVPPPVQYVMVDKPVQTCGSSPLCIVILVLVIIAVLLLTVILVLILCMGRVPLWPWYYPVWVRRHLRYRRELVKNRRY